MADMTEDKMLEEFRKSFPQKAIQVKKFKSNRDDQVGIKPQYIIERLNDVLGVGGWDTKIIDIWRDKVEDDGKTYHSVICELEVQIVSRLKSDTENPLGKRVVIKAVRAHGGGNIIRGNIADAYKSAKTDAFGKACSYLEIAGDAYKGELEDPEKEKMDKAIKSKNKPKDKPKNKSENKYQELVKAYKTKKLTQAKLTKIMNEVLEEKGANPRELTDKQYELVIDAINGDKK